ncbi:MAG TPA: hypothetical protein VK154_17045 [Chitinophagales bacterium]|nr:hypothetical protein [Chitinophagales bacterium]
MNKNRIALLSVALTALLLTGISSCEKEDNTDNTPATAKLKTYSYTDPRDSRYDVTESYTYDANGRISTITHADYYYNGTTTYTFGSNTVSSASTYAGTRVYALNAEGYATTETIPGDTTYTYLYDAAWHLLQDGEGTYEWTGDNLTTDRKIYQNYEYTDKTNTIGNSNKGITFLGRDSKNLPSKRMAFIPAECLFSYDFDAQNRVTRKIGISDFNMDTLEISTYTYY